jgi:hypothetical protein
VVSSSLLVYHRLEPNSSLAKTQTWEIQLAPTTSNDAEAFSGVDPSPMKRGRTKMLALIKPMRDQRWWIAVPVLREVAVVGAVRVTAAVAVGALMFFSASFLDFSSSHSPS